MRANSRSSIRWRVATAIVALALCTLPRAALPDGGGNGKLVAARVAEPAADGAASDQEDQRVDHAGTMPTIEMDQKLSGDGDRIGDDSDIASVEGSANDDSETAAGELSGGSF